MTNSILVVSTINVLCSQGLFKWVVLKVLAGIRYLGVLLGSMVSHMDYLGGEDPGMGRCSEYIVRGDTQAPKRIIFLDEKVPPIGVVLFEVCHP